MCGFAWSRRSQAALSCCAPTSTEVAPKARAWIGCRDLLRTLFTEHLRSLLEKFLLALGLEKAPFLWGKRMFSYVGARTACCSSFWSPGSWASTTVLYKARVYSLYFSLLPWPRISTYIFPGPYFFNCSGYWIVCISLSALISFGNAVGCFRRTFELC